VSNWLNRKSIVATLSLSFALIQFAQLPVFAGSPQAPSKKQQTEELKNAASQLNDFSLRILKELLLTKDIKENIVIAPLGVASCTSVLSTGAKGKTQDELLKALSSKKTLSATECSKVYKHITRRVPDIDLTFASSIYAPGNVQFDSSFKQKFSSLFDGNMQTANSPNALSAQIVKWVKTKSKNMIVLNSSDISPSNVGVINVLYFKALWKDQFEPTQTKIENFTKSDNSTMTVDMMHQDFTVMYQENNESQMIKLPYQTGPTAIDSPFSMYIVLPKSGRTPEKTFSEFTAQKVTERIASMQYRCGSLALPRFAITTDFSFNAALQKFGAKTAFTPQADFTGMTKSSSAYLNEMSQKLKLIVNERGTEASAFTQSSLCLGGSEWKNPFTMVVNRPFIIILRDDESGAILLLGIVRNPERDKESASKLEQEFLGDVKKAEKLHSTRPNESPRELRYSYEKARDYYVSCNNFKNAKEYSNKLIALAKLPPSKYDGLLEKSLAKHTDIVLELDDKVLALATIKELIEFYFHWNSDPTRDPRTVDEWWEWEKLLEETDKHLIDLHQDRARILDARELVLKVSIRDRAKNKEWHVGAWRRKPTTIGVPDKLVKIDFRQFMNCYKSSLKILEKDTAAMQSLQKNKKAFLQFQPTFQCSGHDDLGVQQLKLARVYLDMKKPEKAVQLLELSILNFFEDKDSNSVVQTVETLIKTLRNLERTSEANELSDTFNYCKNTCNLYIALHKKWSKLQEDDREAYAQEWKRQEREDIERESKHAK